MGLTTIWIDGEKFSVSTEKFEKKMSGAITFGFPLKGMPTRRDAAVLLYHYNCRQDKLRRESRLSYRLKKWFVGLRPVNNWLWRRCQVSIDYWWDKGNPCEFGGYLWDWGTKQNTAILPDYPSIKELSTERSE
jgi:hypothetical protein